MDIGLCMVVKDEVGTIEACLADIINLFAEVVIFDTGSTDGTQALIQNRFGIDVLPRELDVAKCNALGPLRNEGYAQLETPWILCLDADERIARSELETVVSWSNDEDPAGFFAPWVTVTPEGHVIEDYKLGLFKKGFQKIGMVHENVQPSVRAAGGSAEWTDAFEISHYPEQAKLLRKNEYYSWRLDKAIGMNPDWIRYYWFRGILHERLGDADLARADFEHAFTSESRQFPVECLNAGMALANQLSHLGERERALRVVEDALAFHDELSNDFEVAVNFRLRPWFERTLACLESNHLDRIAAYDFAHGRPSRGQ